VAWVINVAETIPDQPQSTLARPDQARSDRTTNDQANGNAGTQQAQATLAFPTDLINIIGGIQRQPSPAPIKQEFVFELTKEKAAKNFCILKKHGLDLSQAIDAQERSPLSYRLEFRPPNTLKRIFHNHPIWQRMEKVLINRSQWPLDEIRKEDRKTDLHEALAFGNHKGAASKKELLKSLLTEDVRHRYGLIIPRDKVARIPNACLAPMNIIHQFTPKANSDIVDKEHLTHDHSFKWQSGTLVNSRLGLILDGTLFYARVTFKTLVVFNFKVS
jgi:hypothetical protein